MPLGAQASSSPNLGSSAASAAIRLGISTRSWRSRHRARPVQRIHSDTSEPSAQLTAARVSARKVRFRTAWRLSRTCAGRFPNALDIAGFQNARLQAGEVIFRITVALIPILSMAAVCHRHWVGFRLVCRSVTSVLSASIPLPQATSFSCGYHPRCVTVCDPVTTTVVQVRREWCARDG